jgi:hypothetical protein
MVWGSDCGGLRGWDLVDVLMLSGEGYTHLVGLFFGRALLIGGLRQRRNVMLYIQVDASDLLIEFRAV